MTFSIDPPMLLLYCKCSKLDKYHLNLQVNQTRARSMNKTNCEFIILISSLTFLYGNNAADFLGRIDILLNDKNKKKYLHQRDTFNKSVYD